MYDDNDDAYAVSVFHLPLLPHLLLLSHLPAPSSKIENRGTVFADAMM
jgi:hypothetical protein